MENNVTTWLIMNYIIINPNNKLNNYNTHLKKCILTKISYSLILLLKTIPNSNNPLIIYEEDLK